MNYSTISPELNLLSQQAIGCALKVHKTLGPGLLESSYKECLFYELQKAGFFTEKEKALPLFYEEIKLDIGYRVDLMIDCKLIVEIKAIEALNDIHTAQVLTYLKLSRLPPGFIDKF